VDVSDVRNLGTVALGAVTFLVALASGLIPYVLNIELYLLAVAALTDASPLPIVGLTTAGQTVAKLILYQAGRRALNLKWIRRGAASKVAGVFARHPGGSMAIVAASALTGFPPLYGVSLMAGTLRLSVSAFVAIVVVGRVVRFSAVYLAPGLFMNHE